MKKLSIFYLTILALIYGCTPAIELPSQSRAEIQTIISKLNKQDQENFKEDLNSIDLYFHYLGSGAHNSTYDKKNHNQSLEKAYNMMYKPRFNLKEFKQRYQNTLQVSPIQVTELQFDTYQVILEEYYTNGTADKHTFTYQIIPNRIELTNKPERPYDIVSPVKIKLISSVTLPKQLVEKSIQLNPTTKVYTYWNNGERSLILEDSKGKTTILKNKVPSATDLGFYEPITFAELIDSKNPDYIFYTTYEWKDSGGSSYFYVYNVNSKSSSLVLNNQTDFNGLIKFINNNTQLLECQIDTYPDSEYQITIYNVPDFKPTKRINSNYTINKCEDYNEQTKELEIKTYTENPLVDESKFIKI